MKSPLPQQVLLISKLRCCCDVWVGFHSAECKGLLSLDLQPDWIRRWDGVPVLGEGEARYEQEETGYQAGYNCHHLQKSQHWVGFHAVCWWFWWLMLLKEGQHILKTGLADSHAVFKWFGLWLYQSCHDQPLGCATCSWSQWSSVFWSWIITI